MIKLLRNALAFPVYLAQAFVSLVVLTGLQLLSKLTFRLMIGAQRHVYWPIVVLRRIIDGRPRWQVIDVLALGIQPRTDAERAVADADKRLIKGVCNCDNPNCRARSYLPNPFGDRPPPMLPSAEQIRESMKRAGLLRLPPDEEARELERQANAEVDSEPPSDLPPAA